MRRRDFAGSDDLRAMQAMCTRLWSPTARFHPGQLAWSRYHQDVDPTRPGPGEAISLWWRADDVVGFGWAEAPDWLEFQLDPAYPELGQELLEWFEDWSDADTQSVLAMHGDAIGPDLTAAGFVPKPESPYFVHHLLDLARLPAVPALDGYTLRHIEPGEARARAACHGASWSDVGRSRVTATAYSTLMTVWPYCPDLDWVVIDAAGGLVASALVWFDPTTGVGLLEPVGCVPEHRGRGLAGAVSLAALHHVRGLGAGRALVTPRGDDAYPGPRRLYQRLGFKPGARTVTWTRSLG